MSPVAPISLLQAQLDPAGGSVAFIFFEPGEQRDHRGTGPRVVRVGTHALKNGAKSTLWSRLAQHKGSTASDGGNHRVPIFRLIVGDALPGRRIEVHQTWGKGSNASAGVKAEEGCPYRNTRMRPSGKSISRASDAGSRGRPDPSATPSACARHHRRRVRPGR